MNTEKRTLGLRAKLLVAFGMVSLVLILFVIVALGAQITTAKRSALLEAEAVANAVADSGGQDAINHPALFQQYITAATTRYKRDTFVVNLAKLVIADSDIDEVGSVFTGDHDDSVGRTMKDGRVRTFIETSASLPNGTKQVVVPLRERQADPGSPIVGAVVLEYTPLYNALIAEAQPVFNWMLAVGIACVFATAVFGMRVAAAVSTPISELHQSVSALAAGNYLARVDVKSNDELGALGVAFNRMAAELSASHTNLIEHQQALEERVISRTEELQETNEALGRTNEELGRAQSQLVQSEKMASLGQLAAGVAHEINNPVGYVVSNMGTLQRYLDSVFSLLDRYRVAEAAIVDAAVLADLRAAKKDSEIDYVREDISSLIAESKEGLGRVKKIVADLKEFSHPGGDNTWVRANLHTGFDASLNIVHSQVKYKADLIKEYGEIPDIECVPSQLNQIIMNLVVNAVHAFGEARGTITVRTGRVGENVWFEVADNGHGMSKEIQSRIFDPFFTTKPLGQGTGLGLSLSYGIVQKHGGRIEVQSEEGKGTTFRVWLPITHETGDVAVTQIEIAARAEPAFA